MHFPFLNTCSLPRVTLFHQKHMRYALSIAGMVDTPFCCILSGRAEAKFYRSDCLKLGGDSNKAAEGLFFTSHLNLASKIWRLVGGHLDSSGRSHRFRGAKNFENASTIWMHSTCELAPATLHVCMHIHDRLFQIPSEQNICSSHGWNNQAVSTGPDCAGSVCLLIWMILTL